MSGTILKHRPSRPLCVLKFLRLVRISLLQTFGHECVFWGRKCSVWSGGGRCTNKQVQQTRPLLLLFVLRPDRHDTLLICWLVWLPAFSCCCVTPSCCRVSLLPPPPPLKGDSYATPHPSAALSVIYEESCERWSTSQLALGHVCIQAARVRQTERH